MACDAGDIYEEIAPFSCQPQERNDTMQANKALAVSLTAKDEMNTSVTTQPPLPMLAKMAKEFNKKSGPQGKHLQDDIFW